MARSDEARRQPDPEPTTLPRGFGADVASDDSPFDPERDSPGRRGRLARRGLFVLLAAALLYFLLIGSIALFARWLEQRLAKRVAGR